MLTGHITSRETRQRVSYGFDHEVWFSKPGWTPHYAEHVIDPLDGKEKLVMADPHTQFKAFIYDLRSQRIEWEYSFGTPTDEQVHNPHTARMLLEDVANFGNAGDIYCCSPDQKIIVIDRATKTIKKEIAPCFAPKFLHEARLSVDKQHLILTDYYWGQDNAHGIVKQRISDGAEIWAVTPFVCPGKVSVIENAHASAHDPSFGGEYLVCCNDVNGLVAEIKDSDGSMVWACPNSQDGVGCMIGAPHAAIRLGRVEWSGAITVVGSESGGGIVGIMFNRQPIFCIGNTAGKTRAGAHFYVPTSVGLGETTHVFETLDGRIGFIDWGGSENRSNVCVINQLPARQQTAYRQGRNETTGNDWDWKEYIYTKDWDETFLVIKNTGANALLWRVYGCLHNWGNLQEHPEFFRIEKAEEEVAGGSEGTHLVTKPYTFLVLQYKSAVADQPTTCDIYVAQRRR